MFDCEVFQMLCSDVFEALFTAQTAVWLRVTHWSRWTQLLYTEPG